MMLKVYSSEKIRELINNKLMKSNRPQRILVVGGRGCGKTQYMKKLAEEAAKLGPVRIKRIHDEDHYMDALRYSLMDKPKINPYYPVESEFDISYANHIYQMAKANAAMREAEMIDSGVITAEMICEALERLKGPQANVPIDRQAIFWHSDKTAKHASERYDGIHISRLTGNRFRKGEIIND